MSIFEYNEEKHMKSEREEWHKIGLEEGRKEGLKAGEQRLSQLIQALLHADRTEDMQLALSNPEYREKLYREYNL